MDNSTRAAWLAERRTGIGGSDAAAILGLNPWTSPYTVWADKLGLLPERPDNEAMRQGRDFEPYVAERFCEVSGKRVRRVNKMLRHSVHTFMLANIDRDIVGESAGLECKTTSCLNIRNFKDGDFPATYYAQAVHYIAVTGAVRWYVAVLILNQGFHVYRLTRVRDDPLPDWCVSSVHVGNAEIDALIAAERDFWRMVEAKTPPPADGSASTAETLQALYADTDGSTAELFGRESTIREYLGAVMTAAQLGLEPNTPLGQAYLIPYFNSKEKRLECQFQLGYKGLIDLAYRSGGVKSIQAHTVYANDAFTYSFGLEPELKHVPASGERGEPVYFYAVWHGRDGGYGFEVASVEDIRAHARRYSKSYNNGPWQTNFDDMAKKTILMRVLKYAPLKTDFMRGLAADGTVKTEITDDMYSVPSVYVDGDTGEVVDVEYQPTEA